MHRPFSNREIKLGILIKFYHFFFSTVFLSYITAGIKRTNLSLFVPESPQVLLVYSYIAALTPLLTVFVNARFSAASSVVLFQWKSS